jgi:sulfotransferase family protein
MTSPARIALRRLRTRAQHAIGEHRRLLGGAPTGPGAVLLVLGCQRSGTTLVTDLLAADPAVKVYPEHSELSASDPRGLRLDPLPTVAQRLHRSRFPVVVLKPLVESQNAPALLAGLPNARVLWMFRHYADVARSNLARFGESNGIKNLRSIAEGGDDWRTEHVSADVQRVVRAHFDGAMSPWDAAALFWWARNALFFEQELDTRADVRTCRYEELVAEPARVLSEIYAFAGSACPRELAIESVSTGSIALGREIPLSREVAERCEHLLERLEGVHAGKSRCA